METQTESWEHPDPGSEDIMILALLESAPGLRSLEETVSLSGEESVPETEDLTGSGVAFLVSDFLVNLGFSGLFLAFFFSLFSRKCFN